MFKDIRARKRSRRLGSVTTSSFSSSCMTRNCCRRSAAFCTRQTRKNSHHMQTFCLSSEISANAARLMHAYTMLTVGYRTATNEELTNQQRTCCKSLEQSIPPSIVNFSSLATFRNSLNKISFIIYTKY